MTPEVATKGVAVVTGSASGIGRACARRLAADGFEVLGLDLAAHGAEDAGSCIRFDVTAEPAWEEIALELSGGDIPVTALVTSAGILRFGSVTSCTLEDFRQVHEVNVVGTFLGLKHLLPLMARGGGGSAITISSVAGLIPKPNQLAYVSGKWAIRGMTKSAAQDMAGTGVRVNSVHPGPVRTEMTDELPDDVFARQPLRRRAESWEVAGMISFLTGPESAYCTGADFVVDGGHVLQG